MPIFERWNRILTYDIGYSNEKYNRELQILRQDYDQIPEESWETLSACTDYAIDHCIHAAFAKYYINIAQNKRKLFKDKLKYYIDGMNSEERYEEFLLIDPAKWRSPEYAYRADADEKDFFSIQSLKKWQNGEVLPKRDVIVEIGICLGLNSGQVNELLRLAGYEELYPLDLVDMIGWYYLDYYLQNHVYSSHTDKLSLLKQQINLYMKKNGMDPKEMRGDWKAIRTGRNPSLSKEPTGRNPSLSKERIGSALPLSQDIDERISRWKEQLQDNPGKETITDYLTVFFHERIEETIADKSLDQFLNEYLGNENLQGLYSLRHYGYLKKTVDFMNAPERYIKNTRYSSLSLTKEQGVPEEHEPELYINPYCKNFADDIIRNGKNSSYYQKRCFLKIITNIWRQVNVVNETDFMGLRDGTNVTRGRYFKVCNLIDGRKIKGERNRDPVRNDHNDHSEAYVSDLDKRSLIKYAVATGEEDQIGRYLKLAGFWEEDLSRVIDEDHIKERKCDRTDLLIIYALHYRNQLLDLWSRQWNDGRDIHAYRSKLASDFPFLKLLMTINQDIQLASKELPILPIEEKKLKLLWNDLVYPVKATYMKWGSGMEKGFDGREADRE